MPEPAAAVLQRHPVFDPNEMTNSPIVILPVQSIDALKRKKKKPLANSFMLFSSEPDMVFLNTNEPRDGCAWIMPH